jgi:hypothetical protein
LVEAEPNIGYARRRGVIHYVRVIFQLTP